MRPPLPGPDPHLSSRHGAALLDPGEPGMSASRILVARAVLVGVWAVASLVHALLTPEGRAIHWPLGYLLLELLASLSMGYRAWRARGPSRLPWAILSLSAGLEVLNLLLVALRIHGWLGDWVAEASLALTLATGILVLVGILSFPRGQEPGRMFSRRVLDGLIFATSLLFLLWVMGAQRSVQSEVDGAFSRLVAAYLNAALIGGGLVFITSYHPERVRGPLGWLSLSALAWLMGISWWTLSGFTPTNLASPWLVVIGGIPLFQGLAAWSPRPVEPFDPAGLPGPRLARLFPYVPVVAALVVLALLLPGTPLGVMRGAFGIFLVMVALLLLRQFQAIQDLQVARRTLEDRVQARTKALEQAQDMLLRTERMNSLALMGAGLAHDLNNFLAAIKASADLVTLGIEEGVMPELKDLARISNGADRAADLTRRLMAFVHREAEVLSPVDLAAVVFDLKATLGLLLPRNVALTVELQPDRPLMVLSSRLRLEQMVVNLVANARDAMPTGGSLTIKAGSYGAEDGMVRLEVSDTGMGMTPDVRARIFEPFFTTKAPGKGTGLGLPSLKAMVEEAGGQVEVVSDLGAGSTFVISLPRLEEVSLR